MSEKNRVFLIMKLVAVSLTILVLLILGYQSRLHEKWFTGGTRKGVPDLGPASARPQMKNFKFEDLNRQSLEITSLKGKVIHLNFWAQWCLPCLTELPLIQELTTELGPEYIPLLINTDATPENVEKAMELQRKLSPNLYSVFNNSKALVEMLNVTALPGHIIVDKNGRIAAAFVGTFENETPKFKLLLRDLLREGSLPDSPTE